MPAQSVAALSGNRAFSAAVQRLAAGPAGEQPGQVFAAAARGASSPIPYRSEMERAFGEDFSSVRSHLARPAEMAALGAHAATVGEDVAFASSNPAREVVAHELTHVVQHRAAGSVSGGRDAVSDPDSAPEREAATIARRVIAGQPVGQPAAYGDALVQRDPDKTTRGPAFARVPKTKATKELDPTSPEHRAQVAVFLRAVAYYAQHGFGPWVKQFIAPDWVPTLGLQVLDLELWMTYHLTTFDYALKELPPHWSAVKPQLDAVALWAEAAGIPTGGFAAQVASIESQVVKWCARGMFENRLAAGVDVDDPAYLEDQFVTMMGLAAKDLLQALASSNELSAQTIAKGVQKIAGAAGAEQLDLKKGVSLGTGIAADTAADLGSKNTGNVVKFLGKGVTRGLEILAEAEGGWQKKAEKLHAAGLLEKGEGAAEFAKTFSGWAKDVLQVTGHVVAARRAEEGTRLLTLFKELPEGGWKTWTQRLGYAGQVLGAAASVCQLIEGIRSGDENAIAEASFGLGATAVGVGTKAWSKAATARMAQMGLSRAALFAGTSAGTLITGTATVLWETGKSMALLAKTMKEIELRADLARMSEVGWSAYATAERAKRVIAANEIADVVAEGLITGPDPTLFLLLTELMRMRREDLDGFIEQMTELLDRLIGLETDEGVSKRLPAVQRGLLGPSVKAWRQFLATLPTDDPTHDSRLVTALCQSVFGDVRDLMESTLAWRP